MNTYEEGPKPTPEKLNRGTMVLNRTTRTKISTIGDLYINNEFFCYTLEDYDRDHNRDGDLNDEGEKKVYGKTAIPSGTYKVLINRSARFKRDLPILLDVAGFEGIRIHRGNYAEDSLGCILVGYTKEKDFIGKSAVCEKDLVTKLMEFQQLEIEIK